jgi:pimeloyl-ACP methyl ester carboxylesterase
VIATALTAIAPFTPAETAAGPRLELAPCRPEGIEETLRCGDMLAPEDPSRPAGRHIKLHVVVLPALDAVEGASGAAPLFDVAGGPGIPSTAAARFYATDGKVHRRHREVVLVDQRGTGESSPLRCQELELYDPGTPMYPPAAVRRCRQTLQKHADLAQYSTANGAADLDAVRAALGYDRIDLFGLSYGSRLALEYLRRYSARVRSAVLAGTVADGKKMPLWHARNAQTVFDRVLDECAADPSCHDRFPNVRREWEDVLGRLRAAPGTATATVDGQSVTFPVRIGPLTEAVRTILVSTGGQRSVPFLIHRMAAGDFTPLFDKVLAHRDEFAEGLYLSVTCPEDTLWITEKERDAATARTFLGTYRVDEQLAACRIWNVPVARAPIRVATADVPVLLLAGSMDYVTPVEWAREVAALLPRSRVVVIPGLGHFPDGLANAGCYDEMMSAFYERGDAADLDTSCVARMSLPPFVLSNPESR